MRRAGPSLDPGGELHGTRWAPGRLGKRTPRRRRGSSAAGLLLLFCSGLCGAARASDGEVTDPAPPGRGDGVHGRLRGDMSLRGSLGAEFSLTSQNLRPLMVAEWVGYQTLGVYAGYREAVQEDDALSRSLSAGLTFSPLFLWRFSRATQTGRPFWDLLVDSLGLTGGFLLQQPRGAAFASSVGAELGGTLALPLMGRANGLWLRSRVLAQSGGSSLDQQTWGAVGWLTLTWEGFFYTGLLKTKDP